MKALILIGGYGTRLRPLTLSLPKPFVEFCGRPMLLHQIEALLKVDIDEIILAVHTQAKSLETFIAESCKSIIGDRNVRITFSYESEALDTAGPLAQAASLLKDDNDPFFVLNSDIICDYPFQALLAFHISHGHEGTMAVTKVDEPSKYGAVVHNDQTGLVRYFVEKPSEYIANRINAGLYVFQNSILSRITAEPLSMETFVFPEMVKDGDLYCLEISGFWMDVGQPADYLTGVGLYLTNRHEDDCESVSGIFGKVMVDPTATIGSGCRIGPNVTIGAHVVIEDGVRISNSAIFPNCVIQSHSWLSNCIVGWRSRVGRWVRMENYTVLGENVVVKDELFLNGALVLPHNAISQCVPEPRIIM